MKVIREKEDLKKYARKRGWVIDDDVLLLIPLIEPHKALFCNNLKTLYDLHLNYLNASHIECKKIKIKHICCFSINYKTRLRQDQEERNEHIQFKHDIKEIKVHEDGDIIYYVNRRGTAIKKKHFVERNGNDSYKVLKMTDEDRKTLKQYDLKKIAKEKILDYEKERECRK